MGTFREAWQYIMNNQATFAEAVKVHLLLSISALAIGLVICIPLGIFLAKSNRISMVVLNAVNIGRIIPSLAVLALAMPYVGIGFKPALIALTLLVCPPILINTVTAFKEVDPNVIEAAYGMGMEKSRVLRIIEFPLALPVIITGIRTASVEVIAGASLAAFIGGGGLGVFVLNGVALIKPSLLLVGAIPIALLAFSVELIAARIEKAVTPPLS
ncbi:ABC transporter permease [Paenibacillus eucommiae]|uniref:Osmoprotectant transport system permease protein n=1 Tax=Paenibacillus eucommiae TaxID=1355755 RepID=A0ABS4J5R1_9BACL|nr:ABC transporter permease [Paenibacillus eucommiae]MBP1995182.1 osmoprotectant transport system permease protein [Paenibacillus eucommiae]